MNVDFLRQFCLSFPGAEENLQWEDELCFKVGEKIFAMVSLSSVPQRLCFKCTPEKFAELLEQEGMSPAPYLGRYQWVLLQTLDLLSRHEVEELIRKSYELVSAKLPKRNKSLSRRGNTAYTEKAGQARDMTE
jgi:predicted DNA-binding protein (MmcQ/YjbR family)